MNIKEYIRNNILYLDGGMGTLLQAQGLLPGELPEHWNITHPDVITDIHRKYYDAGSNVVNTNTFGANILKFSEDEYCRPPNLKHLFYCRNIVRCGLVYKVVKPV